MVDSLNIRRFLHPFVLSAIVLSILLYSGILKCTERYPFDSLVPLDSVHSVSGIIRSNPSKVSSQKFYMFTLDLLKAGGKVLSNEVTADASGSITVLVPSGIVEAMYPGKLYSMSQGAIYFEQGETVTVTGEYSSSYFIAESAFQEDLSQGFKGRFVRLRSLCRLVFKRLMYSWGEAGGFILALLSGSREYTEQSVAESFRKAGIAHILALSGMHLSIFLSLTGAFAAKFFGKKYEHAFGFLGISLFVWFAGFSPSLFRSFLCALILMFCKANYFNHTDYLKILCFVFLIHCAAFPSDIFSLSFILSYGALFGLLATKDVFDGVLSRYIPRSLSRSLSSSLGAQLVTFPVCLYVFKTACLFGALASVVITPLVSFFLSFSVIAIVISFALPFLAPYLGGALNVFYGVIKAGSYFFSLAPSVML